MEWETSTRHRDPHGRERITGRSEGHITGHFSARFAMAAHGLSDPTLRCSPSHGPPTRLAGTAGRCRLSALQPPTELRALSAPISVKARSRRAGSARPGRGAVGVRAAGFDGPKAATETAAPSMHAPSTWPGAQSSIGPGAPAARHWDRSVLQYSCVTGTVMSHYQCGTCTVVPHLYTCVLLVQ